MNAVALILERAFEKARKDGQKLKKTTAAEADFLQISPAHYSRIRNARVPVTDKLISQMAELLSGGDNEYAEKLKDELRSARSDATQKESRKAAQTSLDKYSVEQVGNLFKNLSSPDSLLIVDYRDMPQAVDQGAYPSMAEKAREAVQSGLCFALCQPFGSAESLIKKHAELSERIKRKELPNEKQAAAFVSAYFYLYELARKVREFYGKMLEGNGDVEDRVVLYEADVENPLVVASGIQSRLFFADYYEKSQHQTKIYEWVAVSDDEHFFVERSRQSLNLEAVKLQFNPIPAYWETDGKRQKLPKGSTLKKAYVDFGLKSLWGEKGVEVKWKTWPK